MEHRQAAASLAALAHPLRLELFRALVASGSIGLTPGVMRDALQLPSATLSFHLQQLIAAGLATQSRSGRHLVYRAAPGRVDALIGYLAAHCRGSGATA